jgi:TonB family protein
MKKIITFCFILVGFTSLNAQQTAALPAGKPEISAKFNGDINKYLTDNIAYPQDDKVNNIEGTVYVSLLIGKDGSLTEIKVVRGVTSTMDAEAVRVLSQMPKWTPATQHGEAVSQQVTIPIHFELGTTPK